MLGAGVQSGRYRGENRFYDSVKARRNHHLQRAQSEGPVSLLPLPNDKSIISTNAEPEYQTSYEEPEKAGPVPAFEPFVAPSSNLKRFVESIRPSVSAQYPSKVRLQCHTLVDSITFLVRLLCFSVMLLCFLLYNLQHSYPSLILSFLENQISL